MNVFGAVFSTENVRHSEYAPVKKWIDEGNGFLVFGGTKYKNELHRAERYMRLIRSLRSVGKAIAIKDSEVDAINARVDELTKDSTCDDQHIIALLAASKCPLLCSLDARSFEFVKDKRLYPKKSNTVKIYSSSRNVNLLKKSDPNKLKNIE